MARQGLAHGELEAGICEGGAVLAQGFCLGERRGALEGFGEAEEQRHALFRRELNRHLCWFLAFGNG